MRPAMCLPLWTGQPPDCTQMIMCPFAGGSSSAFRPWRDRRIAPVNLSLATWPGRDRLHHQPLVNSIHTLADRLAQELLETCPADTPLLLAGHSMGAQVAFETCRLLEKAGRPQLGLVISGCHAPHLRAERQLSHRDDEGFIDQLVDIGGCPAELRENQALMALFLPLLRADFLATERYHYPENAVCQPINTPALLLCGSRDREASWQQVNAWRPWLTQAQGPVVLEGDHFYPTQQPEAFFAQIERYFPDAFSAAGHGPAPRSHFERW